MYLTAPDALDGAFQSIFHAWEKNCMLENRPKNPRFLKTTLPRFSANFRL